MSARFRFPSIPERPIEIERGGKQQGRENQGTDGAVTDEGHGTMNVKQLNRAFGWEGSSLKFIFSFYVYI